MNKIKDYLGFTHKLDLDSLDKRENGWAAVAEYAEKLDCNYICGGLTPIQALASLLLVIK